MGVMAYSLLVLWVMQDLYHQPYPSKARTACTAGHMPRCHPKVALAVLAVKKGVGRSYEGVFSWGGGGVFRFIGKDVRK